MKSLVLPLALAATAVLPSAAFAQSSASASANVILDVYSALALVKNQDLDMGVVNPGAGLVSVDPASSANAGKFTASGQPSVPITVTFPSSVTLGNGTDNLTLTPSVSALDSDTQGASSTITSGTTATLAASGAHYFWLGGDVNVGAVSTGTYTGSFTLTIAY